MTDSEAIVPISASALSTGCFRSTTLMPHTIATAAKRTNSIVVIAQPTHATSSAVISRFAIATGNMKLQANRINWS